MNSNIGIQGGFYVPVLSVLQNIISTLYVKIKSIYLENRDFQTVQGANKSTVRYTIISYFSTKDRYIVFTLYYGF